jgi:hypothetical protein
MVGYYIKCIWAMMKLIDFYVAKFLFQDNSPIIKQTCANVDSLKNLVCIFYDDDDDDDDDDFGGKIPNENMDIMQFSNQVI